MLKSFLGQGQILKLEVKVGLVASLSDSATAVGSVGAEAELKLSPDPSIVPIVLWVVCLF